MGFSVRVARGVRLRGTSRGLGLATGRGGLWGHTGSGFRGFGVSVPVAGPVRYYKFFGGGSPGTRRASLSQYERQARQAQKVEELQRLAHQLQRMLSIHREEFPAARPPVAAAAEAVDLAALQRKHRREQRAGIPFYRLGDRRAAKRRAGELASKEARRETEERERARARAQAELDSAWERLLANDPGAVLAVLEESFADNEAPAVPVNCEHGRATIVMLMEAEDAVPHRAPHVTPTGRPSSRKLNQTERSQLYRAWLSSNLLATVKEAFAVAPGLEAATVAILRRTSNPFGEQEVDPIYVGTFTRQRFERLDFGTPDVLDAIFHAEDLRMSVKGRTKRLAPLPDDPELAELVSRVRDALVSSG